MKMTTFVYLAVSLYSKTGSSNGYGVACFQVGADGGLVKLSPFVYPWSAYIGTLVADTERRLLYLLGSDAIAPALARVEIRSDGSLGAARPTTYTNTVALHPKGQRAYALRKGSLITYRVSPDGEKQDRDLFATRVAPPESTSGSESLSVHPQGKFLFAGMGNIMTVKLHPNGYIVARGIGESRLKLRIENFTKRLVTEPNCNFIYSSSYEEPSTYRRYSIGADGKLSDEKRTTKDGEEGFCLCFGGDGRAAFTLKELSRQSAGGAFIDNEWVSNPVILQWQVDKNGLFRPNVSKLSDKDGVVSLVEQSVTTTVFDEGGMVSITLP